MLRLIDLNYYTHEDLSDLHPAVKRFHTSYGYVQYIKQWLSISIVKHLNANTTISIDGIAYSGFKSRNKFFYIPYTSHKFIYTQKPDVVLVQGLIFPIQVITLRYMLGKNVKIIAQHHGESPFANSIKSWFQKRADKSIDAYIFTALGNAQQWVDTGVISNINKCHRVLEASTDLKRLDISTAQQQLNITSNDNFLWVGRLIPGKDPLMVLSAFEQHLQNNTSAKLYMIYQDDTLLAEVKACIDASLLLSKAVHLIGKVPHEQLATWYTACDFFISGSHKEAAGFALIECFACGCIPIVTDIPPFLSITDSGRFGLVFEKGNAGSLTIALAQTTAMDRVAMSNNILAHFADKLSYKAIAEDLYALCKKLTA